MRLTKPRVPPVSIENAEGEAAELMRARANKNGEVLNVFGTLANFPTAMTPFLTWASFILSDNNPLPPREREIVILRTGFLCRSGYEWTQHVRVGLRAGLTDAEVLRIKAGADAEGWSPADAALLKATDDLVKDHFISDAVWAELIEHFSQEQAAAVVFSVGQYTLVSMFLNTCGVQLDPGQELDPDLKGF
ncbi:MAG: carboxymuconolactone decarboxylase family protein [Maricaulaceae bacterium]|jgi:alkylhydroperoxidase family enzyme